jgi:hypothetical protein
MISTTYCQCVVCSDALYDVSYPDTYVIDVGDFKELLKLTVKHLLRRVYILGVSTTVNLVPSKRRTVAPVLIGRFLTESVDQMGLCDHRRLAFLTHLYGARGLVILEKDVMLRGTSAGGNSR